jgi:hypothetical protein
MKNNPTIARQQLLRLLADGNFHPSVEIHKVIGRMLSRETERELLAGMLREGLIGQCRGGYTITRNGLKLVPSVQALPAMTPYVASPCPPRREGSDWQHLPSIHAGKPVPYQPHC